MNKNVYITWAEKSSGKSAIVLSTLHMLLGHYVKIGFFRPILSSTREEDSLTQLVTSHFNLESVGVGCSIEVAQEYIKNGQYDELIKNIYESYKELEAECDAILCVGTDYDLQTEALEFDFNIDIANQLNAAVMPIIKGYKRSVDEITHAIESMNYTLHNSQCDILAFVVNRVDASIKEQLKSIQLAYPLFLIDNDETLSYASVGDVVEALDAKLLYGSKELYSKDVIQFKVAAMRLPGFLERLEKGDCIITPSDRVDIILGALLSFPSTAYEEISAIVLTGSDAIPKSVQLLIEGLRRIDVPILKVESDTFTTATKASNIQVRMHPKNSSKISRAIGLVERCIDFSYLQDRLFAKRVPTKMSPIIFEYELLHHAKSDKKHIVLPEGDETRTLKAAEILLLRDVVKITLLGNIEKISARIKALNLDLEDVNIIDPVNSELRKRFAKEYVTLRAHKNVTIEHAYDNMEDVSYFGTMMVHLGYADGMVSGAVHTTQATVRPALQIIKTAADTSIVSSLFLMCLKDRVLVYADCAINPNPNAQELCDIALSSAQSAKEFGIEPKVAMLSYSTGSSGKGAMVDKVKEATLLAQEKMPNLLLEGPMQYDAAIDASVGELKLPDSQVAGQATVFIFPDLNTGNNTYKAVQRSAGALAIGPILQGLNKPINDLSRGCSVDDIVNTIAITAIQAQGKKS